MQEKQNCTGERKPAANSYKAFAIIQLIMG
jgi:hypothetical protein